MRVLVIQDDSKRMERMTSILKAWGYEVVVASDGMNANELLFSENAPSLAIIDTSNPDGFDLIRNLRQSSSLSYVYVLMIIHEENHAEIIRTLSAGADDCLTWPFEEEELQLRLRAGQRIVELQQTLSTKANLDALTGISNHEAIIRSLESELARAKRKQEAVAILMVDLDHFKRINDTFGHLAGDRVLREAVDRIQRVLRKYDSIGRYGGEEFLVILPGCDSSAGLFVAERVRNSISEIDFLEEAGSVSASVGIAVAKGVEMDASILIALADQALYRAKDGGRNRVELAFGSSEELASAVPIELISRQLEDEILQRKKTLDKLKKTEERLSLIANAVNDAIYDWNLLTNEVWRNDGARRLFGYSDQEIRGDLDWWSERLHPEDAQRVLTHVEQVMASQGDLWFGEYRYRKANGTYAYVFDRGYIIYDPSGKPVRMIGAMIDISTLKQTQEALADREAQYRRLIENIPEVVWMADEDGNAMFLSDRITTVFGYTPEECYRQGATLWFGRMHPDDRQLAKDSYQRLFSESLPFDVEYRMLHRDGHWMWWHDRAVAIYASHGRRFADGLLSDITTRKITKPNP